VHPRGEAIPPCRNGAYELLAVDAIFESLAKDLDRSGDTALFYQGVMPHLLQ